MLNMVGPSSSVVPSRDEPAMSGALLMVEDVITPQTVHLFVHVLEVVTATDPEGPLREGLVECLIESRSGGGVPVQSVLCSELDECFTGAPVAGGEEAEDISVEA